MHQSNNITIRYDTIRCNTILLPNRTFLVRFGGISGEFGRAMVRIWARRSRAKIPMARPNEPDMPPKRTKKVRLGIYRTQIQQKCQKSGKFLFRVNFNGFLLVLDKITLFKPSLSGKVRLSLHTSLGAHQAGAYPGLRSMKRLGVLLLPPGWDASPSQGYPQQ